MGQRPIVQWWNELDEPTRKWLVDNPGCVVLPRTVANVVCQVSGGHVAQDQHGELQLSEAEQSFIRAKSKASQVSAGKRA
ncbi:hypothetical protein DBZ45_11450 [Arthrobacter globiformis]|uniref:Uncharacterized protein n=1 Tax=Arthrobacter globiformis TaxID=1665 RepID=A0A328HJL0_ARTGO|nr:hypothetical protein DBZ45_11450 [Arthrobacter globiformis]